MYEQQKEKIIKDIQDYFECQGYNDEAFILITVDNDDCDGKSKVGVCEFGSKFNLSALRVQGIIKLKNLLAEEMKE